MGNGQLAIGNRQRAKGKRQWAISNWQLAIGNRQRARGKRQRAIYYAVFLLIIDYSLPITYQSANVIQAIAKSQRAIDHSLHYYAVFITHYSLLIIAVLNMEILVL